jgi:hypothetical protein
MITLSKFTASPGEREVPGFFAERAEFTELSWACVIIEIKTRSSLEFVLMMGGRWVVRDARRLDLDYVVGQPGRQPESIEGDDGKKRGPGIVTYCVISGVIATAAGSAVSLAVVGTARFVAWAAVLASVSVVAGLGYGSTPVNVAWDCCRRSLRRVVDLWSISWSG